MADFCKACSEEHFDRDFGELARMASEDGVVSVICEGCGPIFVDHAGVCVSPACLCHGQPGHGPYLKSGQWWPGPPQALPPMPSPAEPWDELVDEPRAGMYKPPSSADFNDL